MEQTFSRDGCHLWLKWVRLVSPPTRRERERDGAASGTCHPHPTSGGGFIHPAHHE